MSEFESETGSVKKGSLSASDTTREEHHSKTFGGTSSKETVRTLLSWDPTYRIGKLPSANNPPVSVTADSSIQQAITLMLMNDFSQLPVMEGERTVKGVISWRSLGSRLVLGLKCERVRDCMDRHYEVSSETSFFGAMESIVTNEYVLVRAKDGKISGIVTTADLSIQFRQLGEPFLLIGEIESHLRRLLQDKFSIEDLQKAKDPEDQERVVETVVDLTFGEYIHLLEDPEQWPKLQLAVDRSLFVNTLHEIRDIRNDVMHFDPVGIGERDLVRIRNFVRFLQDLRATAVI